MNVIAIILTILILVISSFGFEGGILVLLAPVLGHCNLLFFSKLFLNFYSVFFFFFFFFNNRFRLYVGVIICLFYFSYFLNIHVV